MAKRIVVTGMGIISPVGNDVETAWNALKNGKSGAGVITRFDPSRLESKIACEVKDFDPNKYMSSKRARKMALFSHYAVAAAVDAFKDAGFTAIEDSGEDERVAAMSHGPYDIKRCGVIVGNGVGGIDVTIESEGKRIAAGPGRMLPMTVPLMIINEAAGNIAMRLKMRGPALSAVTACASGTDALGQALDLLRAGRIDMAIAGGTEAALIEYTLGGFCRLKALSTGYNDRPTEASRPFDKDRDGFVIGEGAAMFVLEEYEAAKKRGAKIYAEFAGYGASCDAYHLTAPEPDGTGSVQAVQMALADAGLQPSDVQYYNAHGTSTQLNDKGETAMLKTALGEHARKIAISSTKSMTGHCIGAAGAIEAFVCIKAIQDNFAPPTINLQNPDLENGCDLDYVPNKGRAMPIDVAMSGSLGFGGHNSIVIFKRVQ